MAQKVQKKEKDPTVLGIDTSQPLCSLAVLKEGIIIGETRLQSALPYSSHLLPAVEALVFNLGLCMENIDLFAVASGPGSFTGIRIGMSSIMGLAAPDGRPVAGISTLRAIAWQCRSQGDWIAPLIPTARELLYAGLYGLRDGRMEPARKDRIESPQSFLESLPEGRIVFCGNGSEKFRDFFKDALNDRAAFCSADPYLGPAVTCLGIQDYFAGADLSLGALVPNNLRPSDAEYRFLPDQK